MSTPQCPGGFKIDRVVGSETPIRRADKSFILFDILDQSSICPIKLGDWIIIDEISLFDKSMSSKDVCPSLPSVTLKSQDLNFLHGF